MNNNILPSDEFIEYEGQFYTNPQKGLEESNTFIDNLRNVQNANNAEINAQTRNLGSAVPSNLGGLVSGEGYWTSRYQTPQTNAVTANLRATAQAQALNEAMSNNLAMYKKRYNDAYRAAQRRANAPVSTTPSNSGGEDPDFETTTPQGSGGASVPGISGAYTVVSPDGRLHVVDMNTGDETSLAPGEKTLDRTKASQAVGGGTIRVLPNGNRVLVKPGYGLTKEGDKYYLVNQSNGNRTQVGG